ncbi:Clavaminate synthase-like protein [Crepidotus variabilis]|uniref:Clavaminate synthase-like protein n=1 Tax=Crepidotus variabilis TaxID=179855 RepID=A0A9P6EV25_9AGAR|nr:Clavaminate synthase-like protein [Crepidotus variabilis]
MTITLLPISFPPSLDPTRFGQFGREVKDVHPGHLNGGQFEELEKALYTHDLLLFRNLDLTPEEQYKLVKKFDPNSEHYGHGNRSLDKATESIIHSYVKSLPFVPQVQIIGHGTVQNHEGIEEITLKHGRHPEFHKTSLSTEDEAGGFTRFFRWHMDAALYDLAPPKVTALYGLKVPRGPLQTVRYGDGSRDELPVPLGTTAFVSGKIMFDILSDTMKSLAVRATATYAPHPFQWIKNSKAFSTGLGLVSEGLEMPLDLLPSWEEEKIKKYPFVWKNTTTGHLHLQVHPCAIKEIDIQPLKYLKNAKRNALYPQGGKITDLKAIRDLIHEMQRPGIAPQLVYPHAWEEKDLVLFNNRGLMHSVVGVFREGQVRLFHQCNLAASSEVVGPNEADIEKWA